MVKLPLLLSVNVYYSCRFRILETFYILLTDEAAIYKCVDVTDQV